MMHWFRSIGWQFTRVRVLNLLIFEPLEELVDRTLDFLPLAEIHILPVVSDHHILPKRDILVQLEQYTARKEEILDTVERIHWLALELLGNAIRSSEVQDEHIRPGTAFVQRHEAHLHGGGLVRGRSQFFLQELESRSDYVPKETALVNQCVVVLVDVVQRFPVFFSKVVRKGSAQALVRIDHLVKIREAVRVCLRWSQFERLHQPFYYLFLRLFKSLDFLPHLRL